MARKDRDTTSKSNGDDGDSGPKPAPPSRLRMWLEEAWEGWLKSVGLILLLGGAYVAYRLTPESDRSESFFGSALVLLVVLGSIAATALPAWSMVKTPASRALFVTMVAVWAVAAGYPTLRTTLPPRAIGDVHLTTAQPNATIKVDRPGALELSVSGHFKQHGMSEAEANYAIKVASSGTTDEVDGTLKRSLVSLRTSRRGGRSTTVQERTENTHRLATVRGPGELTFTTDSIDDKELEDGLTIAVRPGALNPLLFMILSALVVVVALGFDARLVDAKSKVKTYLTAGAAMTLVFAIHFPDEATPHSLVRPAIGAAVLGILIGGLGGWLLGAIGRLLFGPKSAPKKSRR
jgi:hypothetical protein